jgi:predicted regulator of Ras-like GTPase activity (Roadblock/LC7/MglB family)
MAILEQVKAILADIRKEIPDIKAITLAGKDGVPIYSDIGFLSSDRIDEETISAMGVLIYSTARKLNAALPP